MALIGQAITLIDVANRTAPDGSLISNAANLLSRLSPINEIMPLKPSNGGLVHTEAVVTALPTTVIRGMNQGIPSSKSEIVQQNFPIIEVGARMQVDTSMAAAMKGESGLAAFRTGEIPMYMASMSQQLETVLFYGSMAADPRSMDGLATQYNLKSGGTGGNIIDAGGTFSANSSAFLVGWGNDSVFGVYPEGTAGGLLVNDLGVQLVTDAAGNQYSAFVTEFKQRLGLVIKDWRNVVRIANLDTAVFKTLTGTQATTAYSTNLIYCINRAMALLPNPRAVKMELYVNRSTEALLISLATAGSSNAVSFVDAMTQFGMLRQLTVAGIPVRVSDAILNTEARVV